MCKRFFHQGTICIMQNLMKKLQKNTVIMKCFAVTVILGLISWKGIKAQESE
mgnify:CR=1 FL=1